MSIRRRISSMLFGLSVPQEYVCLAKEELDSPFSFYLTTRQSGVSIDITKTHLFLGYKPVIIGIPINDENAETLSKQDEVCISVSNNVFETNDRWKGLLTSRDSVARMTLERIDVINLESTKILLFRAVHGEHSFISDFNQTMNNVKRNLKSSKNNAIQLEGNLADQVRIAYAIPRIVSVITLQAANGNINMFPTDLHGAIGQTRYMSSLRIGGKASKQVDDIKRIVVSDVEATSYNDIYRLGKNHMKEFQSVSEFDVGQQSTALQVPLPRLATSYRELDVKKSFDIGIHRIYLYDILNSSSINASPRLSHVHQYAAQWRINRGLQTPSLLRS